MVSITFKQVDGSTNTIDAEEGINLMEGAVLNGIDGILADCGGVLTCATCHVKFDPDWSAQLPAPSDGEIEMLELAVDPDESSRLSCQIKITESLEGLVVMVPEEQG